jgi:hypothetical protein
LSANDGGAKAGGLLDKQVIVSDASFLTLYDLTFHATEQPDSAVFRCSQ